MEIKKNMPREWDFYDSLSIIDKGKLLNNSIHTLIAQQFEKEDLKKLSDIATQVRQISKSKGGCCFLKTLLEDKRAMLYFAQPSSRTYLSFNAACQTLGLNTMDVRDSKTSSEIKGESPEDTVRTFSSYVDLIIMRHPLMGFSEKIAWMLSNTNREIPVINAGSGADQHPTQALLDIYTLERSFENLGGISGKKILFSGDLKRGRTVRSLSWLLSLYDDVKIYFAAPKELQISQDIIDLLNNTNTQYDLINNLEDNLAEADAIYMTRLQDEWDDEGIKNKPNISDFKISADHLKIMKKNAIIMHPLPRREEIATDLDNSPNAMYWRQMRNGMWIRAALILCTFKRENLLNDWRKIT